ncbi:MAG TPA: hypothetical protein VIW80_13150 [Pyrinomonadaceae bacterium]|jgi:uncharacterized BrkB/YihY/UPF0761 family membrane protein
MNPVEYQEWQREETNRSRNRKQFVILFIFSLFGVTAPIVGTLAGIQAYRQRKKMAGESGAFLALGYGAAAIGIIYTLIFLLVYLGL